MAPRELPRNQLFDAIVHSGGAPWVASARLVELAPKQLLYGPDSPITHAYFPLGAVLSVRCLLENGDTSEIVAIGNEGMLGAPPWLAHTTRSQRVQVQHGGSAYRIDCALLQTPLADSGPLRHVLQHYGRTLNAQLLQEAICVRHHCAEQRLCKWLQLMAHRSQSDQLHITQEVLAAILGVRRECVNDVLRRLQQRDIVQYTRGRIEILAPRALACHACECGTVMLAMFAAQQVELNSTLEWNALECAVPAARRPSRQKGVPCCTNSSPITGTP